MANEQAANPFAALRREHDSQVCGCQSRWEYCPAYINSHSYNKGVGDVLRAVVSRLEHLQGDYSLPTAATSRLKRDIKEAGYEL